MNIIETSTQLPQAPSSNEYAFGHILNELEPKISDLGDVFHPTITVGCQKVVLKRG